MFYASEQILNSKMDLVEHRGFDTGDLTYIYKSLFIFGFAKQEKILPGVIMASGGQVFDMLYQLADLDEPK